MADIIEKKSVSEMIDTAVSEEGVEGRVVAIDLGTTNSVVTYYDTEQKRPRVIPVDGQDYMPSVVYYKGEEDVVVGQAAKSAALLKPKDVVISIKTEMGAPDFKLEVGGAERTPEEISSEILKKLKQAAEERLGGEVNKAVITIPANFHEPQIAATKRAAELAGLEVLQILEEPSAAGIAYQAERELTAAENKILVYDLGGGTFDCSILKTPGEESVFEIIGCRGDNNLGGDDFDRAIMHWIADSVKEESGEIELDIMDEKKDDGVSTAKKRQAQQILKDLAERAKIELADVEETEINHANIIQDESGKSYNIEMTLTRQEFEAMIADKLEETKTIMVEALKEGEIEVEEIDRVILVGGSTKIPAVHDLVTEFIGKEPYGDTDPATCVAEGAALCALVSAAEEAAIEAAEEKGEELPEDRWQIMPTSVRYDFGLEIAGQDFDALIRKGDKLPAEVSDTYAPVHDEVTFIKVKAYEAEPGAKKVHDEGVTYIGEVVVSGLEPKPAGEEEVKVTFRIDKDRVLHVEAEKADGTVVSGEFNR